MEHLALLLWAADIIQGFQELTLIMSFTFGVLAVLSGIVWGVSHDEDFGASEEERDNLLRRFWKFFQISLVCMAIHLALPSRTTVLTFIGLKAASDVVATEAGQQVVDGMGQAGTVWNKAMQLLDKNLTEELEKAGD